ncbi:Na+/H+ antiporter NhaA [Hydrotalea sandarakina]|jgi:NhaA family Na+:H+ antiporter|uniref:Na(+)/H(+) antiporter NhaA n=1 Tax=Hydrotalea sandarakina TaxID=1004304 RepID=A0A2W7SS23_9BACT|nr:Na+/H+ antiporter NhaA [Hydrotalea sandarakina]PZX65845.1 NhaA family Na+:H+ antiporter [Hydrotalea sandarakina]
MSTLKNNKTQKWFYPLLAFMHDSRSIGIILLACTALSLIISNIPAIGEAYTHLWHYHFNGNEAHSFNVIGLHLPNSPLVIINDFLMAFFFFLAGMEIKREVVQGELNTIKKALLPSLGAVGGMLVPAILFIQFNRDSPFMSGWAIPTATDIAFSLGIASLLGNKVSVNLKIFLTALAIIDDLGAIIVIALFYGEKLHFVYLLGCAIVIVLLWWLQKMHKKFGWMQIILSVLLWYFMFNSGIHATVAGVIFAFFIPLKDIVNFEVKLHLPVYFIIIPIFALANTAIVLPQNFAEALDTSLSWGIIAGLVIGKPLGICGMAYLMVKRGWAVLPAKVNWHHMIGAGMLAGIGFTMSIFIATLAFKSENEQDIAKISVLIATIIAMTLGYFWLKINSKPVIIKKAK